MQAGRRQLRVSPSFIAVVVLCDKEFPEVGEGCWCAGEGGVGVARHRR